MNPGIPRIVALLRDSDVRVRSKAAESFGKLIDGREFICVAMSNVF
jgi:HEAT repeat protein